MYTLIRDNKSKSVMCQLTPKRTHAKYVIGYRVYERGCNGELRSFYNGCEMLPWDYEVPARIDPFHAFRSKKAVKLWFAYETSIWLPIEVHKVLLCGDLLSGTWENRTSKTYTGLRAKRMQLVAYCNTDADHRENNKLTWLE